jgi:hypothetical protein
MLTQYFNKFYPPFLGTSKNAVMTQIWIAMIYYLVIAYIKAQTKYSASLHRMTEIFSITLFLKTSLINLLSLDENNLHILDPPQQTPSLQLKLPI